jgi:hypothetical protein
MARKVDVRRLKAGSTAAVNGGITRMGRALEKGADHYLLRWMAAMTIVEIHSVWERYIEKRLVAALNHDATHFFEEEEIKGITHVSTRHS